MKKMIFSALGTPFLCSPRHSQVEPCAGLDKIEEGVSGKMDEFMNSFTTAARIAIFVAIEVTFAPALFAQGSNSS
jgi:hypothetical protein